MNEWISPIDRHRHFGDAGRAECAVCCLEAERNQLRAVCDAVGAESIVAIVDERDRLRAIVDGDDRLWAHVVMQIMLTIDGGRRTWGDPLAGQVISAVADLEAERDRLRAVVDAAKPLPAVAELQADLAVELKTRSALDEAFLDVTAERDRLRAVALAMIRAYLSAGGTPDGLPWVLSEQQEDAETIAATRALLDVSELMGGQGVSARGAPTREDGWHRSDASEADVTPPAGAPAEVVSYPLADTGGEQ